MLNNARFYSSIGMNVIPCNFKFPKVPWNQYSKSPIQNAPSLFDWEVNAIACISGVNDYACLDFDKADLSHIDKVLSQLQLPPDYPWCVESGSGVGFHIWFRFMKSDSFINKYGDKSVHNFYPNNSSLCHHLEVRLKSCYTLLPPSSHLSGLAYSFRFAEPSAPPPYISESVLEDFIASSFNFSVLKALKSLPVICAPFVLSDIESAKLSSAVQLLSSNLGAGCYPLWNKLGLALCSLGKEGLPFFMTLSNNPNYNDPPDKIEKHFFNLLRSYNGSINLRSVFFYAKHFGWKPPFSPFWSIPHKRVIFDYNKYIAFLSENNFSKYFFNGQHYICYTDGYFVKIVDEVFIKDYVTSFVRNLPEYSGKNKNSGNIILNAIIKNNLLFKRDTLQFLPSLQIALNNDTPTEGFFFFRNCYVRVTANSIDSLGYETLDSYIFSDRVVNREFTHNPVRSDFETFCFNICDKDQGRFDSLCSAIGFLLHSFKNPLDAKAIIFTDQNFSEGAAGRSGKSLLAKSLSYLRNLVELDGKNFTFSDRFAFQRVTPTTALILFNDIDKNFSFEKLYNIISDTLIIQAKNQPEQSRSFQQSPKIILTCNNSVRNADPSAKARKFEIEFSSYYNLFRTPYSEFKKLFFDQWVNDDWNTFFSFMFKCLQYYLQYGLVEYNFVNLNRKKVMDGTCPELWDFVESNLKYNEYIPKAQFYEDFKAAEPSFTELKAQTFYKWIKYFASVYNYTYMEKRIGLPQVRHFAIFKPETIL